MFDICEIVVTAPDREWLTNILQQLVTTGLVARANLEQVQSMYLSAGELRDEPEFRASLHTRRSNVTTIVDHIHRDTTGQASCIIAIPITDGHPAYLQWVRTHTKPAR
jgi:periplasmic divalent cation tolerance protein